MAVSMRKTPIKYRRGKPMPKLANGDVIDLSTWPLHSYSPIHERLKIELCPTCGRKGEFHDYGLTRATGRPTPPDNFTHLVQYRTLFWMVRESCNVSPDVQ